MNNKRTVNKYQAKGRNTWMLLIRCQLIHGSMENLIVKKNDNFLTQPNSILDWGWNSVVPIFPPNLTGTSKTGRNLR